MRSASSGRRSRRTTEINRKDFGLNWNGVIESGGVVVGDRVKIELQIAATRDEA